MDEGSLDVVTDQDQPKRVTRLVVAVTVGAVAAVVGALLICASADIPVPSLWRWLLVCGLCTVGVVVRFDVPIGSQRLTFHWGEGAFVLSLVVMPVPWIVPAVLTAVVPGFLVTGAVAGLAPIKVLFNAAARGVAAAAGAAVVLFGSGLHAPTPPSLPILLLAGLTYVGVLDGLTAEVISAAGGLSRATVWRTGVRVRAVTTVVSLAAAMGVAALAWADPRLVALFAGVAVLVDQEYIGRWRERTERAAGLRLSEAVRSLPDLDETVVVRRAATAACELVSATGVEVLLYSDGPDGPALLHRQGQVVAGERRQVGGPARSLAATIVPLDARGEQHLGEMRIYLERGKQLGERQRAALDTLAAATQSAVLLARAHQETSHLAELRSLAELRVHEATHDMLTGLPTRRLLLERMESHLAELGPDDPGVAVLVVRLNHFTEVTHTLGHDARDRLVQQAAQRLQQASALGELLVRLDDLEFAVFLAEAADPAVVRGRADQLLAALAPPLRLAIGAISLTGAVGVSYAPPGTNGAAELLRQATAALAQTRRSGVQVEFYEPAHDTSAGPTALLLTAELRQAMREGQLVLLYQPILDVHTGAPAAAEAMVRWRHPSRGLLSPTQFLPVLEQSSLLADYTDWLLAEALAERASWEQLEFAPPVSVNISPLSLLDPGLPARVAAALATARLQPDQLMLELTESAALSAVDTVDVVLEDLHSMGVRIAIDDFGTGHSSLTRLLRVPATDLKIAPEFVADMLTSPQARTIVRAAIEIANSYGLTVTAVGVDSASHAAAVRELGAHAAQGRQFYPPLVAAKARSALSLTAKHADIRPTADVISLRSRRPRLDG